ncbi:type II toxin-antitoxin system HipA family toxin [Achromobacter arsenitoxydans]|uniref:HipA-like C-terminal domain-containing protein 1 n=1 Tax=Achromobacter arsenitoxydans SY8 TaxID=477184 RepID=H0F807_9BURK|nr:HipA domain-containing protein [Achromobacter arsenitoxydans]EHK65440.1 hipA-like C-terminal domain-containing protein 1 [Achromobacter arsenitoxydans SY8]
MEGELFVYVDIQGEAVLAGVLTLDDTDEDRFYAEFTYVQSYVNDPRAFSLDPLNLPLTDARTTFRTESRYQTLGAIFDAAPDAWGRNVMRVDNAGARVTENEVLLKGRGMGVGALFFSARPLTPNMRKTYRLPEVSQVESLGGLLADIDQGIKPKGLYRDILGSSWDIGGARPKTIVRDGNGEMWIAKFPRKGDSYDRQRVEYANLQMARAIGLNVPAISLANTPLGAVLLTHRFDRILLPAESGADPVIARRHFLSGASLISPSVQIGKRELDGPRGKATYSYARLADVTRRISSRPVQDLLELYARMILNVAVHNTDDHLKNVGFLKDDGAETYRLSPLFDVVTQEGSAKHYLHIGSGGRESSFANCLSEYRRFGLRSEAAATSILDRVLDVVRDRRRYYEAAGMAPEEIALVESTLTALRQPSAQA